MVYKSLNYIFHLMARCFVVKYLKYDVLISASDLNLTPKGKPRTL